MEVLTETRIIQGGFLVDGYPVTGKRKFDCRIADCFDCDAAPGCPILKELFTRNQNSETKNLPPAGAGACHPKNGLNELTGAQWLYFTKTLLTTSFPSAYAHHLRKAHGANKPPQLMKLLIEFFTKRDGKVLDPFAGVGGTLIGAAIANPPRQCVGIEINRKWIEIYHRVVDHCREEGNKINRYEMIQGHCLEILKEFPDNHFQFIATDPPYNTHFERTMCTGRYQEYANRRTDYNMRSDHKNDLANLSSYQDYLDAMEKVLEACLRVLEPCKYMAVIIRNAYQNGEYIFTHADLAQRARKAGFIPKGEIIWYQAGTRLRPYGYPYSYVPNIVHQYILIFQKPDRSIVSSFLPGPRDK
ncbi:MAG: RsmD family RNA methyltransferase [Peptococcaceae bacterium]|nr:RsmD family RNA methyltransferase [Peptococcaceae bacterium]